MQDVNFFSHDPDRIEEHLNSGKALCMVLNKDLPGRAIGQGVEYGYVLLNPYNGEEHLVVAMGCYKNPVKRFDRPDPAVIRKCKKAEELTEGIYPKQIFTGLIEDPLCLRLNRDVLTDKQINMFERHYETIKVEDEDEIHTAIACVYFDPNYETEGKVIAQWHT